MKGCSHESGQYFECMANYTKKGKDLYLHARQTRGGLMFICAKPIFTKLKRENLLPYFAKF
jgi:hypothetical protein